MNKTMRKNDSFAAIAARGIGGKKDLLHENREAEHPHIECPLFPFQGAPLNLPAKMRTSDELHVALRDMRARYKPFLENHVQSVPEYTERIEFNSFLLNGKEHVNIPHYGGPEGYAVKTYDTEFELLNVQSDKAYYFHCEGADYITKVYVNGVCIGIHEGFFAPFSWDVTAFVQAGRNTLRLEVWNDFIYGGNVAPGETTRKEGDKLYAATGLGYDDSQYGWHHCPPAMGVYGRCYLAIAPRLRLSDLWVRPLPEQKKIELWAEVENADYATRSIVLETSLYGQNFVETVWEKVRLTPLTVQTVGLCDSLTESQRQDTLGHEMAIPAEKGANLYRFTLDLPEFRWWTLDDPWLYQIQVGLLYDEQIVDAKAVQFGMRSFTQDCDHEPKGMYYLNGQPIRLRGANTMGFEQQDILRGDFAQLIEDILLAKICHMNYWRLTQRPVQKEVYDYCDRLGLLTQTDLPLFGCMRRTKFAEGIRQAEEMARIVRSHPCNIQLTYINEPFPNANNKPHRHLIRAELEDFFGACDKAVYLHHPDAVIKHVDGDYDPPTDSLPDNHCYPMWYNAHGIDIGQLYKGRWIPTRPGWYYGCGEYGAEGLDFDNVMTTRYPEKWLREPFDPANIIGAQTAAFHYFFFDDQPDRQSWIAASQAHQSFATTLMTEAFRRDNRMVSNAIHLFIDAWPAGWMKTIMDCQRQPKPAYFAYRDALTPVLLTLRSDRWTAYCGELLHIEAWISNDTNEKREDLHIVFEWMVDGKCIQRGEIPASMDSCRASYCCDAVVQTPQIEDRQCCILRAALMDAQELCLSWTEMPIEVFAPVTIPESDNVVLVTDLPDGESIIAGEKVQVKPCGMLPVHFVSCQTGHAAVKAMHKQDFSYWYDANEDCITPLLYKTFTAEGFTPILTSGNQDEQGSWGKALACAEKQFEGKRYVICLVDLRQENPVAQRFLAALLGQCNDT